MRASYSPSGRAKEHRRARPSSPASGLAPSARAASPRPYATCSWATSRRGAAGRARGSVAAHGSVRGRRRPWECHVAARLGELAAPSRRADPCREEEDPRDADVGERRPSRRFLQPTSAGHGRRGSAVGRRRRLHRTLLQDARAQSRRGRKRARARPPRVRTRASPQTSVGRAAGRRERALALPCSRGPAVAATGDLVARLGRSPTLCSVTYAR